MNREKKIITTSFIGIGGNLLLVISKAIIGIIVGSIVLILDAVNNLSDALSSIITIIGTKLANKRPDKKHPYGHGRVEYLTSLIIAIIILVAGGTAIYEAIKSFIEPTAPTYNYVSLIIISAAILVKVGLGLFFRKIGKETQSDALVGSGIDALFDALLSLATLVGAIVAMFANVYIEGYLGIVIGLFILKSGFGVLAESVSNIIGRRPSEEVTKGIKELVAAFPEVNGVYDLILNNYGPNRAIGSVHIEVDDKLTAKEIHPLSRAISTAIYEKYGAIVTVGIYASYSDDEEYATIKKEIYDKVHQIKDIIQIHAFYIDLEKKVISFDIVIDFENRNPKDLCESLKAFVKEKHPEYDVYIVIDNDFSD